MVASARLLYGLLKLLPVQRKVLLITREPKQITVDFTLLQDSIARKHPTHRVVVVKHKKLSLGYLGKALREMYHLATCQACVVDGYIVPVSILNHRPDLQIGQIWHALGALKNFGHLASGTKEGVRPEVAQVMHMHQNYTFVTASGAVPAEIYTAAFGVPRVTISPLGMPRIDYLLDPEGRAARRTQLLEAFPQLGSGRVVVYAPTFRRGRQIPYTSLAAAFGTDQDTLVLLPHPNDRSHLPEGENVLLGQRFSVLDWLSVADVIITDYSAVTYEAALCDIPLVFWPYDIDEYTVARGLALDYQEEVPGPVVNSATEAVSAALRTVEAGNTDYATFRSRHLNYITDGNGALPRRSPRCADRIVDALELE